MSFASRLIGTGAALAVITAAVVPAHAGRIEGYPTEISVLHGENLALHVRSEVPQFSVSIWRQGRTLEQTGSFGPFPGVNHPIPAEAWAGCGWPVSCEIPVTAAWTPGAYLARLETGGEFSFVPFIVRTPAAGSIGPILVQLSTNTWQAYNRYGGKSLYDAYVPGLTGRAYKVSFHRPYNHYNADGSGQFFTWEAAFLAFLESYGYAYEVCTGTDLQRDPSLLDHYRLFCSVGHDEYYSKETLDALERYADQGGNLAFFSGNSIWWQIRYEDNEHTIVCYKSAGADPLLHSDPSRVTVNWHASPVLRAPSRLMGLYYNGSNGIPVGGYSVVNPAHWVFDGISVQAGQSFGYPMVGFEVDSRTADSPMLDLIARTELPDHNNGDIMRPCDMIYYERTPAYGFANGHGGGVFAGGTTSYAMGLTRYYNTWMKLTGRADPVARALTVNVLDRLGGAVSAPALVAPADSAVVVGSHAVVQWRAARAQRPGINVSYIVHWQTGSAPAESVATEGFAAWIPVATGAEQSRWWVEARSTWGQSAVSPRRVIGARAPTGAESVPEPPLFDVVRHPKGIEFRIFTPAAADGSVDVFTVSGRRVYGIRRPLGAGISSILWNCTDGNGRSLPVGLYMARARAGTHTANRKVFVAR